MRQTRSRPGRRAKNVLPVVALVAAAAGCVSAKAPTQTNLMKGVGATASAQRVRVADHNIARNFMALVELTADSVAGMSDDPGIDYNALVWKANAIPAIQMALYHPEPLVAFTDGWILLVQMREYFESGGGSDAFGEYQPYVVRSLRDAESELETSIQDLNGDPEGNLRAFVHRWADEHPITNERFLRRSPTEAVADLLGAEAGGGLSSLGTLTEMAGDAQQMALVMASYVPRQITWQSELLLADLADSTRVASLLGAIDDMEVVSATTEFMRVTPQMVAEERAAVFREIAEMRLETFRDIDALRRQSLQDIAAILAAERSAAIRDVAAMVTAERKATTEDMARLTAQAFEETRGLVNHLMLWIAGLGLGLVVAVALLIALYRRRTA